MSAGDFMYFSLGFIFYKYLSEKIEKAVDTALIDDGITFKELWQSTDEDAEELKAEVRNQCMDSIGYFIEPEFLFSSIIASIKIGENILPNLNARSNRLRIVRSDTTARKILAVCSPTSTSTRRNSARVPMIKIRSFHRCFSPLMKSSSARKPLKKLIFSAMPTNI